jgi:hypothetical protein
LSRQPPPPAWKNSTPANPHQPYLLSWTPPLRFARIENDTSEAIILVEAEIWPNFIWKARDMRIPLFLVNARLSDRSFPRYKRFGFLFRRFFAAFRCGRPE